MTAGVINSWHTINYVICQFTTTYVCMYTVDCNVTVIMRHASLGWYNVPMYGGLMNCDNIATA